MKNLIKIVAFSFVLLLGMDTMNAQSLKQDQNTPEVVAKKQTEKLSTTLGLNGDQQRAVFRALVVKENNYAKDVNGKDTKNADVMTNKKKHDEVFDTSMKKALTEEQYKKWKALEN
ncbi:MAG: hypothetical protein R2786_05940 [Flavobacteriaceae bacterium]